MEAAQWSPGPTEPLMSVFCVLNCGVLPTGGTSLGWKNVEQHWSWRNTIDVGITNNSRGRLASFILTAEHSVKYEMERFWLRWKKKWQSSRKQISWTSGVQTKTKAYMLLGSLQINQEDLQIFLNLFICTVFHHFQKPPTIFPGCIKNAKMKPKPRHVQLTIIRQRKAANLNI